jgi:hypothetical protein
VFVNNTVIYSVNNTTYIGNNIKNSATCFGSVEPPSSQIQDIVLVQSASACVHSLIYMLEYYYDARTHDC